MALTFGALTSDRIQIANSASIQNLDPLTFCFWVNITTLTSGRKLFQKNAAGSSLKDITISGTGGDVRVRIGRTGTDTSYITNDTPLSTGAWLFFAAAYDSGASAGQVVNIYTGSLSAVATESTYGTATDGTLLTENDDANDLFVANNPGATLALQGRMAFFSYHNVALSLGQIRAMQFRPRVLSSTAVFYLLGFSGTTTQVDWSGNGNSGTVTGATVADHVPLPPPWGFDSEESELIAAAVAIPAARPAWNYRLHA